MGTPLLDSGAASLATGNGEGKGDFAGGSWRFPANWVRMLDGPFPGVIDFGKELISDE
jgi:hypothetical protein